ncbi:uncharacterized protein LOC116774629 isoform X2 [Danaus plexippus]|uniref:uncharacterized protein LOC116774629 isoform X2 n=1 Tax=Danaus plexippus TaxID=13037 RepID=UPI002AB01534|nr:uncharacterized protein LOC116774629 isoform X2 [Danaus plexippus]
MKETIIFCEFVTKMIVRLSYFLVLFLLYFSEGQRRIRFGQKVTTPKRYMVYLTQAKRHYDSWICGGAIISRFHILTSAACVEDVTDLYAISGTMSYISPNKIHHNVCSKNTKRKIVYTCIPKEYKLDYEKVDVWSYNDIAVVRVDIQYDFSDPLYDKHCQFRPNSIPINFNIANENKGRAVVTFGFGHQSLWRLKHTTDDYNYADLMYTSAQISDQGKCKAAYLKPNLTENIEKYMICTNASGNIDSNGKLVQRRTDSVNEDDSLTRRQGGICQNDHGGPLVTWINEEETVLGVGSVFRVNKESKCEGPYLYTSTARNKVFIECLLEETDRRSFDICNQEASELGFKIVRRYVVWNEDDAAIVDDSEVKIRKQINMNFVGMG